MKIEHLAPYLPYGLKAKLSRKGILNLDAEMPNEKANKIGIVKNISFWGEEITGQLHIKETYSFDFDEIDEIDIVLIPLSEFKYQDIIIVKKHLGVGKWCDYYDSFFDAWFDDSERLQNLALQMPFELMQFFLKNHFDVFGLIEKGEAIDINTL